MDENRIKAIQIAGQISELIKQIDNLVAQENGSVISLQLSLICDNRNVQFSSINNSLAIKEATKEIQPLFEQEIKATFIAYRERLKTRLNELLAESIQLDMKLNDTKIKEAYIQLETQRANLEQEIKRSEMACDEFKQLKASYEAKLQELTDKDTKAISEFVSSEAVKGKEDAEKSI